MKSLASAAAVLCATALFAQAAHAEEGGPPRPPPMTAAAPAPAPDENLVSPLIDEHGAVTLTIFAPAAHSVAVAGDIAAYGENGAVPPANALAPSFLPLTKDQRGFWSTTVTPPGGTYRYVFVVDGVIVVDPHNPDTSSANARTMSVVHVNGSPAEDRRDVPHGALASVFYPSSQFGQARRMHVYTPPGYEHSNARYPVLYLLHGNGDSDDSWASVGRVNFILDNLIAAGQARPMIVVMPAGHWPGQGPVLETLLSKPPGQDAFSRDLLEDVAPYIESHYRVRQGADNRAIAGLSMGGLQALNIALTKPDAFKYVGVFSSGFLDDAASTYTASQFQRARDFNVFYFAWGSEDFVRPYTEYTLNLFNYYGVPVARHQTGGGHTWQNWREYLHDFAPRLFR